MVEGTAGGPSPRTPPGPQHRQLATLDAHVPLVRPALPYDGSRQPRPPLAVALLLGLRARVTAGRHYTSTSCRPLRTGRYVRSRTGWRAVGRPGWHRWRAG